MRLFFASAITVMTMVLIGCSKDNSNNPNNNNNSKETVRVTVTTSSSFSTASNNSVSASVSAFNSSGDFLDMKINGEVSSSKINHSRRDSDFNGGHTYVFETITGDYAQVQVNISGYCIEGPFTLNYKIEQGSKVIADETISFTEDSDVYNETYVVK